MKFLNGSELAAFIKERQARQVRMLRQAHGIFPRLVIIQTTNENPVIDTYVRMKQRYGNDILVDVQVYRCAQADIATEIDRANNDNSVHGIILQLPIDDPSQTQELCDRISPEKDVDGLGADAKYVSATAEAIDWLLSGYGVSLVDKKIAIIGKGKLVGAPLYDMWKSEGFDVNVYDKATHDIHEDLITSDVIVSAAGSPGLLKSEHIKENAVIVDAATVSENGKIVGDAAEELYQRSDLTITPKKGGVGPLTIVLLFDHVIRSCLDRVNS